jgi:hypothetical protein
MLPLNFVGIWGLKLLLFAAGLAVLQVVGLQGGCYNMRPFSYPYR